MIPVSPLALQALASRYGTTSEALAHFGGGRGDSDGIVYAYPDQGTRRLLKVMAIPEQDRQRGLFCLDERLRFMRFLGDNGAPVVFPLASPQGALYETHTADGYLWVAYSMDIAPGESKPFHTWDEALFRTWGQAVGRMHRLAQQYPSWEASVDAAGNSLLTWAEEWQGFYHWCADEQVKPQWVKIGERLKALPRTRSDLGFVHNDPHIANLLVDGDGTVTMIDFDVANHHWFVSDIAIACQSILFSHSGGMERPVQDRQKLLDFLRCFLEGYERENRLAPFWLEQLDLFIAYRRILLFIAMYGWVQSQPETHASWLEMILTQPEMVGDELAAAM